MAQRPVFLPLPGSAPPVQATTVEFKWSPGLSVSQKQKSIASLHACAMNLLDLNSILEISSKSTESLGKALSAFSLMVECPDGRERSLEAVFQSAKVFTGGGPFRDLLDVSPRDAKRDHRLRNSGPLRHFDYFGETWPSQPTTSFYDWLYCRGVLASPRLEDGLRQYQAFTDIEFNPKKSLNCQAASAALLLALLQQGVARDLVGSQAAFTNLYKGPGLQTGQGSLF
jgi:hypothetical protein